MPHQRQVIAEKVRDLLIAAETAAVGRVYVNRFIPVRNHQLPAILVYTLSEPVDPESSTTAPRELTRRLLLAIDGLVAAETEADERMNALALEIEAVLHADPFLAGEAGDSILTDTELAVETVGDRLVGRIALTYEVTYRTLAPEPPADEDLDDFETAGVTYQPPGVHADDAAQDEVDVEEDP